jgi:quinoprotein glucose dehydrogenase
VPDTIALPSILYTRGFGLVTAENGLSPIGPPWSSLTAYDLNQGIIKWKIALGDVPDLAAKGIMNTGSHYPKVGPVVTSGGLPFTGTRDRTVRAFDVETGKVLWEREVDAALEGIPAIYEIGGREFIVFCAAAQVGLTSSSQRSIPGAYVAFALPALSLNAHHACPSRGIQRSRLVCPLECLPRAAAQCSTGVV